jgi:hypothetical protein
MKRNSIRRQAQRMLPRLTRCEGCGTTTDRLERHHPEYDEPGIVVILCRPCHTKADQDAGYQPRRKVKVCTICGSSFTNYTHSRAKTCSKRCLSEAGRRNAAKRWHPGSLNPTFAESPAESRSEWTALEHSATASSRRSQSGSDDASSTTSKPE